MTELIPHRGPAVLLDCVLRHDDAETVCRATVTATMQYARAGQADAALSVELLAQAVAARAGLTLGARHEVPRAGYLVGVPKMRFFGGDFAVGDVLEVLVRPELSDGPLARFYGLVNQGERKRAEGTLTVYESPLAQSIDRGDASSHDEGR